MKYSPDVPDRFGSLEDGRAFLERYFASYNKVHRHSGIVMLTPAMVHNGRAEAVVNARHEVMKRTYSVHPDRFIASSLHRRRAPQKCSTGNRLDQPT